MAEVLGAVASAIGILSTTLAVYESVLDVRGLPGAFREVSDKIPLAIDTLKAIRADAARGATGDRRAAIVKVAGACEERAGRLKLILDKLQLGDGATTRFNLDSYVRAIHAWGKKGRVEDLQRKILEDIMLLAQSQAVNALSQGQIDQLNEALERLRTVTPSAPDDMLPEKAAGTHMSHDGTGDQHNQFGNYNTSNINSGSGTFNVGCTQNYGPGK